MILEHPDADVFVEELPGGQRLLRVGAPREQLFVSRGSCETTYPLDLIRLILDVKGPGWLCDEIARDQDPSYIQRTLEISLLSYFDNREYLDGKRILDFGCGSGSSTVILARMLPTSEIRGVELDDQLLSIAQARLDYYRTSNVVLKRSPMGTELPEGLGRFDLVVLNAVYEHLLPEERKLMMSKLWSLIRDGGHLFLTETPNRLSPIESHTTGLPLVNYMPKRLALGIARALSRRVERDASWEELLRRGIRGGTEREILTHLRRDGSHRPVVLEPHNLDVTDRIDLWYSISTQRKMRKAKRVLKAVMKTNKFLTGLTVTPEISLMIKKEKRFHGSS
jgi:SAM-dependent methyltransferase